MSKFSEWILHHLISPLVCKGQFYINHAAFSDRDTDLDPMNAIDIQNCIL